MKATRAATRASQSGGPFRGLGLTVPRSRLSPTVVPGLTNQSGGLGEVLCAQQWERSCHAGPEPLRDEAVHHAPSHNYRRGDGGRGAQIFPRLCGLVLDGFSDSQQPRLCIVLHRSASNERLQIGALPSHDIKGAAQLRRVRRASARPGACKCTYVFRRPRDVYVTASCWAADF